VSREVYYPGAKHLIPILQLLIPGIDLVSRCISILRQLLKTFCMM